MITLQTTPGYGFQAQQSPSEREVGTQKTTDTKGSELSVNPSSLADDSVSISDTALLAASNKTQYYEQALPTYEGFSATNIAAGVSNPGVDTFSAGKTFDQVATAARASMDNNYERLGNIGKPYNANTAQSIDRNSVIGELDRRALYAVASNEGDLFSKDEQSYARSKMSQQTTLAMGMYRGPTSEKDKFIAPLSHDHAPMFKAGIQFLDQASNEEKAGSIEFAHLRAGLQRSYEVVVHEQGGTPEDLSTDHPLVTLLLDAMRAAEGDLQRGQTFGPIEDLNDLKRQPWLEGLSDSLDSAVQSTGGMYLRGA